jgi:tetratricopeptide (TPR) repeat protein
MGNAVYFQHSGGNQGFSCLLIAHKQRGYGAVVMINSNAFGIISEVMRSIAREYGWEDYLPPPYEVVALGSERLRRIEGRYLLDSDRMVTVLVEGGRVMADVTRMSRIELMPISESEFVSREDGTRVTFVQGPVPAGDSLRILGGGRLMGASRAANDRKVPYELLCAGAFDEAADGYRAIRKSDPSDAAIEESALNQAGYRLLRENKIKEAIILFRLNVDFYPNSWNVYDSLGEAYAASGAKALAVISYKKSLELNPKNTGALEALKKLEQ